MAKKKVDIKKTALIEQHKIAYGVKMQLIGDTLSPWGPTFPSLIEAVRFARLLKANEEVEKVVVYSITIYMKVEELKEIK